LSHYSDYEGLFALVVMVPAFVAEISFCLWLLIKGIGPPRARLQPVEVR
jgi:hypothetical protein